VNRAKDVRESGDFIKGTFYLIQVAEALKSRPPKISGVDSENGSGRFPMKVGVSYLIIRSEDIFEGSRDRVWQSTTVGIQDAEGDKEGAFDSAQAQTQLNRRKI